MPDPAQDEKLVHAIAGEAWRLEEDAMHASVGHTEEARYADRLGHFLGIPATLLAAAAGVTSISATVTDHAVGMVTSIGAGVLSFGVAAMSGITTFLDPKARAGAHYAASNGYWALRNELRYFHLIECKKGRPPADLEPLLVDLRQRLSALDEKTPIISAWAADRATELIDEGNSAYKADGDGAPGGGAGPKTR